MPKTRYARQWLGSTGRAGLLLGLGAFAATVARADTPPSAAGASDMQLVGKDGRIWLSEAGGDFRELRLGDTAEARHLKQLIEKRGPAPLRLNSTVLAGGGGMGFHWWGPAKPESPDKAGTPGKPGKADKAVPPQKKDPVEAGKKG
jgi:hypothetical protein